ncbi:MAG: hypothetical protein ACP5QA_12055 [Phycisphaerae bacterium]
MSKPRQPAWLNNLKGNPGRHARNLAEPPKAPLKRPPGLNPTEQGMWMRLVREYAPVLRPEHQEALRSLATKMAIQEQARQNIAANGIMHQPDPNKPACPNPAVKIYDNLAASIWRERKPFARLMADSAGQPPAKQESKLARVLRLTAPEPDLEAFLEVKQ